jgi:Gpi18-like mannosyltransferase
VDHFLLKLLYGFLQWDSRYFQYIARHGYTTLESLAFFPGYPLSIQLLTTTILRPLTWVLHVDVVLLLSGILISNVAFVATAMALYRLGVYAMGLCNVTYYAALLFCFNPASVFFSVCYSESLFALCTFLGLEQLMRQHYFCSSLLFALSSAIRSNGLLNAGFILWPLGLRILHTLCNRSIRWVIRLLDVFLLTLAVVIFGVICVMPFAIYQRLSFEWLCLHDDKGQRLENATLYVNDFIDWISQKAFIYQKLLQADFQYLKDASYGILAHHPDLQHFLKVVVKNVSNVAEQVVSKTVETVESGTESLHLLNQSIPLGVGTATQDQLLHYCAPIWCNQTLPLVYSQVQQRWNVGFLEYFQWQKMPLFCLAAPAVLLVALGSVEYFQRMHWPLHKVSSHSNEQHQLDGKAAKLLGETTIVNSMGHSRPGLITENTIAFLVHAQFLTVFGVFFFNVEVLTRILFSASPVLPWFCALCLCDGRFLNYWSTSNKTERSGPRTSEKLRYDALIREEKSRYDNELVRMLKDCLTKSWSKCLILMYFLIYFLIGIFGHGNGLPWT